MEQSHGKIKKWIFYCVLVNQIWCFGKIKEEFRLEFSTGGAIWNGSKAETGKNYFYYYLQVHTLKLRINLI